MTLDPTAGSGTLPPNRLSRGSRLTWAWLLALLVGTTGGAGNLGAGEPHTAPPPNPSSDLIYGPVDKSLQVLRLDSLPTESSLGVRLDSQGRIFVGGREALFVYEPDAQGGYHPRQELLRFPSDTWIYDIAIRGHDLYLATVSAIYVVPQAVVQRRGLRAQRLVWGVPNGHVHQCLHGLAFGPEGDLYFSMGDPAWYFGDFELPDHWGYWTFFNRPQQKPGPDGLSPLSSLSENQWVRTRYNGVGGVFRCKPDGTDLRIVCRGLRNSCGLVFDRHWNLFTNDNDHEGMPSEYVPGRLNHVVPHAYFSWPRGWMLSKTPDRADLLETMLTTLGRAVPVGQSYYDDQLLPVEYRQQLLVARWCTRQLTHYPLRPYGATFHTDEHVLLQGRDQARPVGVCVGRGGRIFATLCYMAQNESSPVYRSDLVMLGPAQDPPGHPYEAFDVTALPVPRLAGELQHADWSRRSAAHLEWLRRGLPAQAVRQHVSPQAVEHFPWLLAATRDPQADRELQQWSQEKRLTSADPAAVRAARSALLARSEFFPGEALRRDCERLLRHSNPTLQLSALLGLWSVPGPVSPAVWEGPAQSSDTYLRQLAALLLAERCSAGELEIRLQNALPSVRLAVTLAAGFKLTLPPVSAEFPAEAKLSPWRKEESYLLHFADETVDLRKWGRVGMYTVTDVWKSAPHTAEQEVLFRKLSELLSDSAEPVRLQAAYFLSLLNDPRSEPAVVKVRALSETQRLTKAPLKMVNKLWVAGPFSDQRAGFQRSHPPQEGVVDLNARYAVGGKTLAWKAADVDWQLFDFRKILGEQEDASYYAYTRLESSARQSALLLVGSDDGIQVWVNGHSVWKHDVTRSALPTQDSILVPLQAGSNELLIRVHNLAGESGLYLHYRGRQPIVHTLPERIDTAGFAARLRAAAQAGNLPVDPAFLQRDWVTEASRGDPRRGRQLFSAQGLGCAKCHAVAADAPLNAGPSLAEAKKRFTTPHLVESILLPGKQVSPVFRASLIVTRQGKQYTGLVVGETAEKVELLQSDATRVSLPAGDIEERKLQELSPMPAGLVKTTDELRDVLAYLLSDSPPAP